MNHTPHILATVFLCGLWLPIWILISLTHNPPWRCSFCGYTDSVDYLSNPYLRQQHAAQAAEQARIREATRLEREGSTIQEQIAYFVADNKVPVIAGGVLFVIAVIGITFYGMLPKRVDPIPAQQVAKDPAAEAREIQRAARKSFTVTLGAKYWDLDSRFSATTSGSNEEVLFIVCPSCDDKFVRGLKQPASLAEIKKVGFKTVRIQGKKEWSFDL